MRRLAAMLAVLLLAACTLALPRGSGGAPAPLATEAIEVTKLDAAGDAGADPAKAEPTAPVKETAKRPAKAEAGKPVVDEATPPGDPERTSAETPPEADPDGKAAEPAPEAAEAPPAPLSPAAQACQRKGGRYVKTGSGDLRACVKLTGDGGKSCRRETDCEGACLARSGTCAPQTPLFGCNDVLQADGRRVTLCLD